jgi:hypothetical protein
MFVTIINTLSKVNMTSEIILHEKWDRGGANCSLKKKGSPINPDCAFERDETMEERL